MTRIILFTLYNHDYSVAYDSDNGNIIDILVQAPGLDRRYFNASYTDLPMEVRSRIQDEIIQDLNEL